MLPLLLALSSPALADVASGPDDCAIEYYDSAHCEVCSDAYYDDPDACEEKLGDSLVEVCSTSGASTWDEIWCEEGYTERQKSCGCAAGGAPAAGGLAFALLTLGLAVGRRRG
jgi:MYXO-CTERM domain-containing protein